MARPLMKASIVFIFTLAISVFLPTDLLIATATILAAVAFLLFLIFRKRDKIKDYLKLSVFAVLSLVCLIVYNHITVIPAQSYKGKTAQINATILSSEISSNQNKYYTARIDKINTKPAPKNFTIRLFCLESDDLDDYDKISAEVSFFEDDLSSLDFFYLSNNILASAKTTGDIRLENKGFSLLREICKIRDKMVFNIRANLSDDSGSIICGILFGKRDYIPDEVTMLFSNAGISHLLAISGLHLSIIVLLINLLLGVFRINKIVRSILTAIITAILMIMVGFTPSIMRSSIMIAFLLIAENIRLDYDAPTALSFSAVIICLINPYSITNIGFLLSFCATIGILVSNKILDKLRMKFSLKTVKLPRLILYKSQSYFFPAVLHFYLQSPFAVWFLATFRHILL